MQELSASPQTEGKGQEEGRRQGPRPLALPMWTELMTWLTSRAALPLLKGDLLPWRPELKDRVRELRASLDGVAPEAFAAAIDRVALGRATELLAGIEAYRRHPYARSLKDPPEIWREGSTRLLDFGATHSSAAQGAPVLVVPSLVNRAYIMDLSPERSLLRYLASCGLRPLLVDWDAPGAIERDFSLSDYVAGRLERVLDVVLGLDPRRPVLLGYCMGGLLAMALSQRRQEAVAGQVLLATPWDFHSDAGRQAEAVAAIAETVRRMTEMWGVLPVDMLQLMFHALDVFSIARKYRRFAHVHPSSARTREFVAMEDWLNDGVALAGPVARECLTDWYVRNQPLHGQWRVGGTAIRPEEIIIPSLVVVPTRDYLVPPASSLPLVRTLPNARVLEPAAGHIGMVVGHTRHSLWRPLAAWINETSAGKSAA